MRTFQHPREIQTENKDSRRGTRILFCILVENYVLILFPMYTYIKSSHYILQMSHNFICQLYLKKSVRFKLIKKKKKRNQLMSQTKQRLLLYSICHLICRSTFKPQNSLFWEGIYRVMTDLHCMAKANTTLQSNYPSILKKSYKKK